MSTIPGPDIWGPRVAYFGCPADTVPITLHLDSAGPCGGIDFPSDTLRFGPVPEWARVSFTGGPLHPVFVGEKTFTAVDVYAGGPVDDWTYILNNAGLWRMRQATGATIMLGNPIIARQCGPPFRWPFACGSSSIACVIHE